MKRLIADLEDSTKRTFALNWILQNLTGKELVTVADHITRIPLQYNQVSLATAIFAKARRYQQGIGQTSEQPGIPPAGQGKIEEQQGSFGWLPWLVVGMITYDLYRYSRKKKQ